MTTPKAAAARAQAGQNSRRIELIVGESSVFRIGLPARGAVSTGLRRAAAGHQTLAIFLLALSLALYGNLLIHGPPGFANSSEADLAAGAPWLGLAFVAWLLAELYSQRDALRASWNGLDKVGKRRWLLRLLPALFWLRALSLLLLAMSASSAMPFLAEASVWTLAGAVIWLLNELAHRLAKPPAAPTHPPVMPRASIHSAPSRSTIARRFILLALAIASTLAVWENTANNSTQPVFIALWFASALLWSLFFAPLGWNAFEGLTAAIDRLRRFSLRKSLGLALAFALIMALGILFRFSQLDSLPREMMHSDHEVEITTALGIMQGHYPVMTRFWSMHESPHTYFIALFAALPGLGLDFYTLKLVAALESLLALPLVFWAGRELMGRRERGFGLAAALMIMGFVAVSYWHNVITRYSTRTQLLLPFAALTLIFLARALNYNRRGDYIWLGLSLGFGMYSYTPSRVLPLVVVAGVLLAIVMRPISWRERLRYLVNLGVCGFITVMLYLPMHHVSLDEPTLFYTNNTNPVFGVNPGEPINLDLDWFITGLLKNYRRALLMLVWLGDPNRLQSVVSQPALDLLTGALLPLGLAAFCARLARSPRDPVLWLTPALIVIMLLPTTLAVAEPVSVPSITRASAIMPGIYLLVSLAVLRLARAIARLLPRRLRRTASIALCALVLLAANHTNSVLVFDVYPERNAHPPYSHIGKTVRGLIESGSTWGNIIFIPHAGDWAIHNIYIEAGNPDTHSFVMLQDLPNYLESARNLDGNLRLDPSRDLVFVYPATHHEASAQLARAYPQGRELAIDSYLGADDPLSSYMIFRVPAIKAPA